MLTYLFSRPLVWSLSRFPRRLHWIWRLLRRHCGPGCAILWQERPKRRHQELPRPRLLPFPTWIGQYLQLCKSRYIDAQVRAVLTYISCRWTTRTARLSLPLARVGEWFNRSTTTAQTGPFLLVSGGNRGIALNWWEVGTSKGGR
jgi:hypothetical protein